MKNQDTGARGFAAGAGIVIADRAARACCACLLRVPVAADDGQRTASKVRRIRNNKKTPAALRQGSCFVGPALAGRISDQRMMLL